MHWSVGMLLHAVCVFFFRRRDKKKETCWKIDWGCFPRHIFSSQHGAVDLDYIPFISSLDFSFLINVLLSRHHPCFDAKQMSGCSPFFLFFVLARFCCHNQSHLFSFFHVLSWPQYKSYLGLNLVLLFTTHITSCIICCWQLLCVGLWNVYLTC